MKRPSDLLQTVRASYWFVPTLMAVVAVLLGATMVWVSAGPGSGWLNGLSWYQSVKPDGAQQVLSTIAGSMITVAGVVFSITIVAIAYASSQYGPRILSNFMSDRGNQVTLGTFIATFVYCLLVLRTIRAGDEEFVPHIAVMVGLLLAFCSIGVLIYFIHHVPQSIHINNVVEQIGCQFIALVEHRYPNLLGDPSGQSGEVKDRSSEAMAILANRAGNIATVAAVASEEAGYLQAADAKQLMAVAETNDLFLRLLHQPGGYIYRGRTLLEVWPAERLTPECARKLRNSYTIGSKRTPSEDLNFPIDELVEIAARALSTGVNDPYTAITCLDWLGAGLSELAHRRSPSEQWADANGSVRIFALPESFASFAERAFGRTRQYVARDMNAALHMLRTIGDVAADCRTEDQVDALRIEADRLIAMAETELHGAALDAVRRRAADLRELLKSGAGQIEVRQGDWLRGCGAS